MQCHVIGSSCQHVKRYLEDPQPARVYRFRSLCSAIFHNVPYATSVRERYQRVTRSAARLYRAQAQLHRHLGVRNPPRHRGCGSDDPGRDRSGKTRGRGGGGAIIWPPPRKLRRRVGNRGPRVGAAPRRKRGDSLAAVSWMQVWARGSGAARPMGALDVSGRERKKDHHPIVPS